jgi:hypothetical protein
VSLANWSLYPAKSAVDLSQNAISNCTRLEIDEQVLTADASDLLLNGIPIATITSISNVADWALFQAISNVNMSNFAIQNLSGLELDGNQVSTLGDTILVNGKNQTSNWSSYTANTNVNLSNFAISNVSGFQLDGTAISTDGLFIYANGSNGVERWAQFPATTLVNMSGSNIQNVDQIDASGVSCVDSFINTLYVYTPDNNSSAVITSDNSGQTLLLNSVPLLTSADISSAADWATYPAMANVNMSGSNILNASQIDAVNIVVPTITLCSGITPTSSVALTANDTQLLVNGQAVYTGALPPSDASNWAQYPANASVNMNGNSITAGVGNDLSLYGGTIFLNSNAEVKYDLNVKHDLKVQHNIDVTQGGISQCNVVGDGTTNFFAAATTFGDSADLGYVEVKGANRIAGFSSFYVEGGVTFDGGTVHGFKCTTAGAGVFGLARFELTPVLAYIASAGPITLASITYTILTALLNVRVAAGTFVTIEHGNVGGYDGIYIQNTLNNASNTRVIWTAGGTQYNTGVIQTSNLFTPQPVQFWSNVYNPSGGTPPVAPMSGFLPKNPIVYTDVSRNNTLLGNYVGWFGAYGAYETPAPYAKYRNSPFSNTTLIGDFPGVENIQGFSPDNFGNNSVHIGQQTISADYSGTPTPPTLGDRAVAIGTISGWVGNATADNIIIGTHLNSIVGQGSNCIAIGQDAGSINQANTGIAIGLTAGQNSQEEGAIAIGYQAGVSGQNTGSIAIGNTAGGYQQGTACIAVGSGAGSAGQGQFAIAVGSGAGAINQGVEAFALGASAGGSNQGAGAFALGTLAGASNQGVGAVSIGSNAGGFNQGGNSVAIGNECGQNNQGSHSIAIGNSAINAQGNSAVAIGYQTAVAGQGENSIAIGTGAGYLNQQSNCIAIGFDCGSGGQKTGSIALGVGAGDSNLGANSIAIGTYATQAGASLSGTIVINATGLPLNPSFENSCYVAPVRSVASSTGFNVIAHNTATGELIETLTSSLSMDGTISNTQQVSYDTGLLRTTIDGQFKVNGGAEFTQSVTCDTTIEVGNALNYVDTAVITAGGDKDGFLQGVLVQNICGGANASTNVVCVNDSAGTDYVAMGINSSTFSNVYNTLFERPNTSYFSGTADTAIGSQSDHAQTSSLFLTYKSGEKGFCINSSGALSMNASISGGAVYKGNFGISGQLLVSAGSDAPPAWATASSAVGLISAANTFWVAENGLDVVGGGQCYAPFKTIQFAINQCTDGAQDNGQTIWVMAGLYVENLTIANKNINIRGSGDTGHTYNTTIRGNMTITSSNTNRSYRTVSFQNIQIQNYTATTGKAITLSTSGTGKGKLLLSGCFVIGASTGVSLLDTTATNCDWQIVCDGTRFFTAFAYSAPLINLGGNQGTSCSLTLNQSTVEYESPAGSTNSLIKVDNYSALTTTYSTITQPLNASFNNSALTNGLVWVANLPNSGVVATSTNGVNIGTTLMFSGTQATLGVAGTPAMYINRGCPSIYLLGGTLSVRSSTPSTTHAVVGSTSAGTKTIIYFSTQNMMTTFGTANKVDATNLTTTLLTPLS